MNIQRGYYWLLLIVLLAMSANAADKVFLVRALFQGGTITLENLVVTNSSNKANEEYGAGKKYTLVSMTKDGKIFQKRKFNFKFYSGQSYDCPFGMAASQDKSGCIASTVDNGTIWLYMKYSPKVEKIQIVEDTQVLGEISAAKARQR